MSSIRKPRAKAASPAGAALPPLPDSDVLRSILDAVPTRVTYLDSARRYRFANSEFYAFTGLAPQQVIGRTVSQVLGRRTSITTRPLVDAAREGRATRHVGWRDYPTAGRRYVDTVFSPVFRADGRMDGYFVLARDLTEARIREEELASRNHQLEEILDAAPARVCVTDLDRRYTYVNREFCRFARKRADEIIGLTSDELVGPNVSLALKSLVDAAKSGQTVFHQGWVNYRLNGRRYINYVFIPKRAPDGTVEGVVLFMTDSTELKQREEDLARRSDQLEAILASIGDGVSIVDAEGRLVLANRGFLGMFNYPEELAKPGTPIDALVRNRLERGYRYVNEPAEVAADIIATERLRSLRDGVDRTEEALRSDGRLLEIRRRLLPDSTIVSTFTDVTARRDAERARRAQRNAIRRAERLEATAMLLASVGHEINTPLAIIAAQARMLADDTEGTPFAERAQAILNAAKGCGNIVHSLMQSARRAPRRNLAVDLAHAVEQAMDLVSEGLRLGDIKVAVDIPKDLPTFEGDPDQFAHLVANLLSNAQQALTGADPTSPRRLVVSVQPLTGALVLRVTDNGPGIPPPLRAKIFDAFFTTKPEGQGTGIGLALCRAVVSAHGGRLYVEETPGGGATFVVRIPTRVAEDGSMEGTP